MTAIFGMSAAITAIGVLATAADYCHSVVSYITAFASMPAAFTGGWLWVSGRA